MKTASKTVTHDIRITLSPLTQDEVECLVEPDGSVLAWDDVAESYSRVHSLSPARLAEARRLADLVRAGTHFSFGGLVRPRVY